MGLGSAIAGATQVSAMGTLNGQPGLNAQPPADKPDNSSSDGAKTDDASSTDKSQPNQPVAQNNPTSQVFGGAAILGVTSTSKEKSIREFNKKKHYNEWQFIYDPSTDRGGLLTMPNQQSLQGGGLSQTGLPGQPGQQGFGQQQGFGGQQQNSSFGQPSQFGQSPVNPNQQNPQPPQ
jgi:hypothetical protein